MQPIPTDLQAKRKYAVIITVFSNSYLPITNQLVAMIPDDYWWRSRDYIYVNNAIL